MATKKQLQEIVDWFALAINQAADKDYSNMRPEDAEANKRGIEGTWSFGYWLPDQPTMIPGISLPEFRATMGFRAEDKKAILEASTFGPPRKARGKRKTKAV